MALAVRAFDGGNQARSSRTKYHYDEAGNLLLETDDAGAFLRLYVWADGTPVAQKAGSTLTRLHVDHLNTPRWGTDTVGALVWRWESDGFGQVAPDEDVDGDLTDVVVNLRFPGQLYDAESGLHYNRFRYYDPSIARYDPLGQRARPNVYEYGLNNPLKFFDPLGLEALPGVLIGFSADMSVPDPTDAAWPKWAAWMLALTAAATYDICVDTDEEACYQQYLEDAAHRGEYYTDDNTYNRCIAQAWKNYIRCINGLPPEPFNPFKR